MRKTAAAQPTRPMRRSDPGIGRRAGARANCSGTGMTEPALATGTPAAFRPGTRRPVLEVDDLKQHFAVPHGFLRRAGGRVLAVDGVSFTIAQGETLGLVEIGRASCRERVQAAGAAGP